MASFNRFPHHSANTSSSSSDMDCFNAPVSNAPMPRWKRKALESANGASSSSCTPSTTPGTTPKRPKTPSRDRFIPNRAAMDMDLCRHAIQGKENGGLFAKDEHPYQSQLAGALLDRPPPSLSADGTLRLDMPHAKILSFADKAPSVKEGYINPNRVLYSQGSTGAGVRRNKFRHIPQKPEKILDAPNLLEDFYLNLVDWGSNNILAVALSESVYLWNADTGDIDQLCETSAYDDCITSVSWIPSGNFLAVGTNSHEVQIWDVEAMKLMRTMRSHQSRVGSLAWNSHILSSASRDGEIHNHDVRLPRHHVATLAGHTQEVCGLKWSPNGLQLASGANDNTVCIWDMQSASRWAPRHTLREHSAAVKALAWCPWQTNLLATGGGTADRYLRFWNSSTGACVNAVDTKSQVCSIVWSPNDKELVTSHGFSQNQLTVWKYPSLVRMAELKGHTSRVLHMALSPDGQTVVSGAADETLRFWKVFADNSASKGRGSGFLEKSGLSSSVRSLNIR